MICLLVMTDGRDTIHDAIASADTALVGSITHRVIHDDSGDPDHRHDLMRRYPRWTVIGGDRAGFGGAIKRAWCHVRDLPVRFVFHLEDDFTFTRPVDLDAMGNVLAAQPQLLQLALRRQPWNAEERAAGGIIEQHPDAYDDCTDGEHHWLEHRRFWTTNPSLYRRELCERKWPDGVHSEGRFGIEQFRDPNAVSGFWGERSSGEWVHHIGHERVGTGY